MSANNVTRDASTGYMPALVTPIFTSKRAEVRWKVRHLNLCALDRETRQAAAADPAIVWDADDRQYRMRRRSDPPRQEAVDSARQPDPCPKAGDTPPHPSLPRLDSAE